MIKTTVCLVVQWFEYVTTSPERFALPVIKKIQWSNPEHLLERASVLLYTKLETERTILKKTWTCALNKCKYLSSVSGNTVAVHLI